MKALIILVLGLLLMILAALFTGANDTLVNFDYLLGDFQWYVSYLLLSAFIAGMLFLLVLLLPQYVKNNTEKRRYRKKINELQKELENIRVLSLK